MYNRIGKAGSSFMLSILAALSKTNNFKLENHKDFSPSRSVLAQELGSLPDNAAYVNHAAFLNGTSYGSMLFESRSKDGRVCSITELMPA